MTLARWPGLSTAVWPSTISKKITLPINFATTPIVDATGEKYAVAGVVRWADYGTHDIHQLWWRTGTNIVSAGGSGVTISLQDHHATIGNPTRPDEVQDQSVSFLLSTLVASTNYTHTFTTDRLAVAHGARVAVVWEFDGAGRLGADVLHVAGLNSVNDEQGAVSVHLSGTWTIANVYPVLVLVAADGAIGTLGFAVPYSTTPTSIVYNSGSTPDERANQFILPVPARLEGVSIPIQLADGANFSLILYSGTTALATATIDEDVGPLSVLVFRWHYFPFPLPVDLQANTTYRLAVRPDTANSVTITSADVASASHLALIGGVDMHYWDRTDAGAWANENLTRVILLHLHFSATDDGGNLAAVLTDLAQIKADLPTRITKNTAFPGRFPFFMASSVDHVSGLAGLPVTGEFSLDGGATWAVLNGSVAEGTRAGWYYQNGFLASELNADAVAVRWGAVGADTRNITIITQP